MSFLCPVSNTAEEAACFYIYRGSKKFYFTLYLNNQFPGRCNYKGILPLFFFCFRIVLEKRYQKGSCFS